MTYEEAIAYLLSFADFERSGRFQDRPDLAPMLALLHRLGDPHLGRLTVHVAGSKGKGSTAAMIESILRAAGFSTGLYTSPHLHDYTERIRVDGEPVSNESFARLATEMRPAVEADSANLVDRSLVTFDLLTTMGFLAFREAGIQAQVIEVGLGGRVDSTNVFPSKEIALITPLSLEHTAVLGDTIERIAAEKAGIITPACTVVLSQQTYEAVACTVRQFASKAGATVVDVGSLYQATVVGYDYRCQRIRIDRACGALGAPLPLLGAFQAENAATAVAAVDALRDRGVDITDNAIVLGLGSVHWPGRMEVVHERPLVIVDGAHNRDSARRFVEALRESFRVERPLFVVGVSADKDIDGLAEELAPAAKRVFAAQADHPRAMEPGRIADAFRRVGVPAQDVDSVPAAIAQAMAATDDTGVICLVGSLFVAAEGREYFGLR